MRSITIFCSCILALSLFAAPANADPTTNTVFAVFDFGGFSGDGSSEFDYDGTSTLFIVSLATIPGGFFDFSLAFSTLNLPSWINLSNVSYFILGEAEGSEHLILSANEPGAPIDDDFEAMILDGVTNMGSLASPLGSPGGNAFVSPGQFDSFFGTGIGTFVTPGGSPDIPFGQTLLVGGDTGDLLGFTDPTNLGMFGLSFVNGGLVGTFTPVPEPGFALLAIVGLAGTVIARRRRRRAL